MSLTPVEVRHLELRRGLFGFRRAGVRKAMDEIADSFEAVWRERADLVQRVEDLEAELGRHLELENLLRESAIERVVICGLATDYCVKATALDAVRLGFGVSLLAEAVAAVNRAPDDGDRALLEMAEAGVTSS